MADTLTGIARGVGAAIHRRPVDLAELRDLADRLAAFAEAEPRLSPDSHLDLLTRLARAVDPTCPRDWNPALDVIHGRGA